MRMDRYKDFDDKNRLDEEENDKVLSREIKNQDMYKDVYMNNTYVDINKYFNDDEEENIDEEKEYTFHEEIYEEKSYDVGDYLKKAHETHRIDDAKRNLEDKEFIDGEDEIRKLIADIEEKELNDDIFGDLRGDNEDTMIGGKIKTDEFNASIYESLMEDDNEDNNIVLEHELGEETVYNLEKEEESKIDHTFEKILDSDKKKNHKIKKLPLIIFLITLIILIIVILIIIFK